MGYIPSGAGLKPALVYVCVLSGGQLPEFFAGSSHAVTDLI
jgi:hypothetical protein